MIKIKEESLNNRAKEIEDLDKQLIDSQRTVEELKIKMDGQKRQAELSVQHLKEKMDQLQEMTANEKDTREMWMQRYEKEQGDHTNTNASLLQAKSDLKDQVLSTKNAEIKLQTVTRQIDMYQEQNKKL